MLAKVSLSKNRTNVDSSGQSVETSHSYAFTGKSSSKNKGIQPRIPKHEIRIEEHFGLVHHTLHKYNVYPGHHYFDEFFSAAQLGLFKAWKAYDYRRGVHFATFALRCMCNEINMLLRSMKNWANIVSLQSTYMRDKDGKCSTLESILADEKDFFQPVEAKDIVNKLLSKDSYLTHTEKNILRFLSDNSDITQFELGKRLGYTQAYISRLISGMKQKLMKKGDYLG